VPFFWEIPALLGLRLLNPASRRPAVLAYQKNTRLILPAAINEPSLKTCRLNGIDFQKGFKAQIQALGDCTAFLIRYIDIAIAKAAIAAALAYKRLGFLSAPGERIMH